MNKNKSYTIAFTYQYQDNKTKKLGRRFIGSKTFNTKKQLLNYWEKELRKINRDFKKSGGSITNLKKRIVIL